MSEYEYCEANDLTEVITAFNKGNDVSLCRDGVWTIGGSLRWRGNDTSWGSHGEGANPKIVSNSGVFKVYNGLGGFTINDVDMTGSGEGTGSGVLMHNGVHDVTLENMEISGFYIGVQNQAGELGPNNNLVMRDMYIHDCHKQGFLGGGSNLLMQRVKFARCGTSKVLDHNIYVSVGDGAGGPATNLQFLDVESIDSSGVHFVIHGKADGILVDNYSAIEHDLTNYGAWGLAATAGHGSEEYFLNWETRFSYFENTGNHFLTGTDCDGAYVHDCEFVFKGSPATTITGVKLPSGNSDGPTETASVIDNVFRIIDPEPGSHIVCIDLTGLTGDGEARGNKIFYDNPVEGVKVTCIAGRENDDIGDNYFGTEADYNSPPVAAPIEDELGKITTSVEKIRELLK